MTTSSVPPHWTLTLRPLGLALAAGLGLLAAAPRDVRFLSPREIQETTEPSGTSPRLGETVRVAGVVVAISPHGRFFYLSDPEGGPWSGIKVEAAARERTPGETVVVAGTVRESYGETRVRADRVSRLKGPADETAEIPAWPVTVAELHSAAERWEGVLVRVEGVQVTSGTNDYGEFSVSDGGGSVLVDDEFFTSYIADLNDRFDAITGLVAYTFGAFKIEPRSDDDLVGFVSGRSFDGTVHTSVVDETGRPLPSKITFFPVDGAPLELGPDDRASASEDVAYLPRGEGEVAIPSGTYDVVVSRGLEYGLYEERIVVPPGGSAGVNAILVHELDTAGWISGDFHLHSAPSTDSPVPVPGRIASLAGEGVEWAVATDHNTVTDYAPVIEDRELGEWIASSVGDEITTRSPRFGHFNAWPLPAGGEPPPFEGMDPATLFEAARRSPEAEVVQVNHPTIPAWGNQYFDVYRVSPHTGEPENPGWSWDFDAVEVFNGRFLDQGVLTLKTWMAMLNNGRFVTMTGNSDSHHVVYSEPGYPRNFVRVEGGVTGSTEAERVEAVRRGATFLSYGPVVDFTVNGAGLGEQGAVDAQGRVTFSIRVQCASWLRAELATLWANGRVLRTFPLDAPFEGPQDFSFTTTDTPTVDTWYVLEVEGTGDLAPVRRGFGFRPYAVTNPIRVDADGDGAFAAPGNAADRVAVAEIDAVDANGESVHLGRWVSVDGTATTDTRFLDPSSGSFYLEDGTGGVLVWESAGRVTEVVRGDHVEVRGFVGQGQGETRIVEAVVEVRGAGLDPGPVRVVTTGELDFALEPWEGRVLSVDAVNVVGGSWPAGDGGATLAVDDGSGPALLVIPPGMTIPAEASQLAGFPLVAILGQRDFSPPYTSGYALTLRSPDDLPLGGAVDAPSAATPLGAIHPNPFRTELRIPYAERPWPGRVEVLDVSGRRVRTLPLPAGDGGTLVWDGRDENGRQVASGVYWIRLPESATPPTRVVKVR